MKNYEILIFTLLGELATPLNGCHLHKIVDTISSYFSNNIKTCVGIGMNDVAIFRFK